MGNQRLPKIALDLSQKQLRHGCKDTMAWLTHWGIDENNISQNIDNAKNIITSKFKDKLWREEKLAVKRKIKIL